MVASSPGSQRPVGLHGDAGSGFRVEGGGWREKKRVPCLLPPPSTFHPPPFTRKGLTQSHGQLVWTVGAGRTQGQPGDRPGQPLRADFCVKESVQIVPLPGPQIVFAGAGPAGGQEVAGLGGLTVFPQEGGLGHVALVQVLLGLTALLGLGAQRCLKMAAGLDRLAPLPDDSRQAASQAQGNQGQQRRRQGVPPDQFDGPTERVQGSGLGRLSGQETAEVLGESRGAGIAFGRGLFQALQDDRLQVAGDAPAEARRGNRLDAGNLRQQRDDRVALERRPAGQAFVKDRSEGIDVRGRADVLSPGRLFRGHVTRRAEQFPGAREVALIEPLDHAEVGHLHQRFGHPLRGYPAGPSRGSPLGPQGRGERRGQQDVGRLQIAMHQPQLMRGVNRQGHHADQRRHVAHLHRAGTKAVSQRAAADVLQCQIRLTAGDSNLVDLHNVRMLHPRQGLGFALQPQFGVAIPGAGAQHLQGHRAPQTEVACLVNDAHAAAAQFAQDLVAGHVVGERLRQRRLPNGLCLGSGGIIQQGAVQQELILDSLRQLRKAEGILGRSRSISHGFAHKDLIVDQIHPRIRIDGSRERTQVGLDQHPLALLPAPLLVAGDHLHDLGRRQVRGASQPSTDVAVDPGWVFGEKSHRSRFIGVFSNRAPAVPRHEPAASGGRRRSRPARPRFLPRSCPGPVSGPAPPPPGSGGV